MCRSQGYSRLKETLLAQRERMLKERDAYMEEQRRRDEQVMREHQAEAARKGETRLKAFYREQKQVSRDRGGAPADASEMKDFEAAYVYTHAHAHTHTHVRVHTDSVSLSLSYIHLLTPTCLQIHTHSLFEELQGEQAELERRLLQNRLRWIMPWFFQFKAIELLQYTQVHALRERGECVCKSVHLERERV
jgi:hypothetical protein